MVPPFLRPYGAMKALDVGMVWTFGGCSYGPHERPRRLPL